MISAFLQPSCSPQQMPRLPLATAPRHPVPNRMFPFVFSRLPLKCRLRLQTEWSQNFLGSFCFDDCKAAASQKIGLYLCCCSACAGGRDHCRFPFLRNSATFCRFDLQMPQANVWEMREAKERGNVNIVLKGKIPLF